MRRHVRISTDKAAVISFDDGQKVIMCVIRDISEGGAGLAVATTDGIPDQFLLTVKGEEEGRACTVRWRQPNRLGVSFEDASS